MTGIWTSFAIIIIPATKARYFGEIVQCATTPQKLLVRTTMLQEYALSDVVHKKRTYALDMQAELTEFIGVYCWICWW